MTNKLKPVAKVKFTERPKPDVEWLADEVRNGTVLYAIIDNKGK